MTLTLGGTFYEGAPQYEVVADGAVIATRAVASEQGDIVELDVGQPAALAIRFVNDLAGPKGEDGLRPPGTDRNLIIEAVAFDGRTVLGKDLVGAPGVVRSGDYATVAINQTVDIPLAPAIRTLAAVTTLDGPAIDEPPAMSCEPVEVHLTGYANGKMLPSAKALAALEELVSVHGCSVIITGYSSLSGSAVSNKKMAQKRATAILDYLVGKGAEFAHVDVAGWGATDLFGKDEAANRRVVVSVQ